MKLVRDVLATITSGQELDLRRFAPLESTLQRAGDKLKLELQPIIALETEAELDDYTYRVAGCVGEFWTKICRAHLFPQAQAGRRATRLANGIRFGKGLQLVNILRDLPADLRKGRCYLPAEKLEPAGLLPEALLSPANEAKFLPLYHRYLDAAESHLAAGWAYTNALPFGQLRVRLACAWPILIGLRTIERLRAANVVELQQRIKISRGERRGILLRSVLAYPAPGLHGRNCFPPMEKLLHPAGNWRKKTSCKFSSCCPRFARLSFLRVSFPPARTTLRLQPPPARR